jgi:Ca2+-transporting ATPase
MVTDPSTDRQASAAVWHTLPVRQAVQRLGTRPDQGLGRNEVARRLREHGPNALATVSERSTLAIIVAQFKSLIVGLLVVATSLAFVLGEIVEGVAILVVIVLNALIGFLTEWKARQALTALRAQAVPTATVVRDGTHARIPAIELVPGDLMVLEAGSRVPADGRVIEAVRLRVEEASLTGESQPVSKSVDPVLDVEAPLGDRVNMAFLGTAVTEGRGLVAVTATGTRTEVGRIGALVAEAGDQDTPLERKLAQLGHALIGMVLGLCAVIVLAGWLRGNDLLHMLEVGISLAIASVPEGLPAVATMTLALGMQRMARMRALVRRLPAVETLGSTTVICSDKTGTLTRNEMTVRTFQLGDRRVVVTGTGYAPSGELRSEDGPVDPRSDAHLALALRAGALCSDAILERTKGSVAVLGDPTEGALLVAAAKAGLGEGELKQAFPRLGEVPFSSESKRMVTVHRAPDGKTIAYLKGAPAVLIEASTSELTPDGVRLLTAEGRDQHYARNIDLAGEGLRVLALAYKDVPESYRETDLVTGIVFIGLVGMIDPLRDEAKAAIATCRTAGIRTIMITGDQQATAASIGRQLGIDRGVDGRPLRAVHGRELGGLDADGWKRVVADAGVFARVSPEHKLRIVEALQAQGEVVAMTGDGVNDAPALKKADIGIAMGMKGTEVAKEAADMVVTDDNFATIVVAVEQGRSIYANILRFVQYLFSCNLAEILIVFVAIVVGWPLPLAALQVLWLNMITDVFPAMALALEPSSPDAMGRPPLDPREPLVSRRFAGLIAWQGGFLASLTLLAFWIGMRWYGVEGDGRRHAVTIAFMTLALVQVFHAFNARSQRRSALDARLFTNGWLWAAVAVCIALQLAAVYLPLLQRVLHTVPLGGADWGLVAACAVATVGVVELVKLAGRVARPRASLGLRTSASQG